MSDEEDDKTKDEKKKRSKMNKKQLAEMDDTEFTKKYTKAGGI